MSRSFGASDVTSRSPMKMLPELTSSNPASIRKVVDLPHPDGPDQHHELPVLDLQVDTGYGGLIGTGIPALGLLERNSCHDYISFTGRNVPDDPL